MTEALLGRTHRITIPEEIGPYKYVSVIGHGSFSIVILVVRKDNGEKFACKVISQQFLIDNKYVDSFKREADTFSKLNHPNILHLIDFISDDSLIYMIMEYCENGDLYKFIASRGALPDSTAKTIFRSVLSAVQYLHSMKIAHRDLKPDNILLDTQYKVELADFGFCREATTDTLMTTKCGSPVYTAPEILSQPSYDGLKSDMWSLGVILFIMVTGRIPWETQNETQLFFQIQTARFHIPETINPFCANLINELMRPQPEMRMTAEQALSHPWFSNECTKNFNTQSLLIRKCCDPNVKKVAGNQIIMQKQAPTYRLSLRENAITKRHMPQTERRPHTDATKLVVECGGISHVDQ